MKNKFNEFLDNNSDQSVGITRLENFGQRHGILINKSYNDYEFGMMSKHRIVYASIMRLASFMTAFRFLTSALSNNKCIYTIMSDANYMLGNQRLISGITVMARLIILLIGLVIQLQEMTKHLHPLKFMNQYKYNRVIALNATKSRKLSLIVNMLNRQ